MSDSIFNAGGSPAPANSNGGAATPPNGQSHDPIADLLGSIKNERGEPKYRDLPTALEALRHSQEFIPQVKTQLEEKEKKLAELAAENARLKTVEETLARLTSPGQPPQTTPVQNQNNGLSAEAVAELVTKTLTQREAEAIQKANISQVVAKASEVFGAEAQKVFYEKAKEVGLSAEQINNLAKQSPQAVFNLLGMTQSTKPNGGFPNPTQGSINTAGYQPSPQSYLGKNPTPVILGASTEQLMQEKDNAKRLVEQLHEQGLSTYDLTDPKVFFKHFK